MEDVWVVEVEGEYLDVGLVRKSRWCFCRLV